MFYHPEIIEEVRYQNDIVSVVSQHTNLKHTGNSYVGLCPFHNEKTGSFHVNADKQLFYCFGCGESGNVISFIMKYENLDFVDAVKFLADRVNYTLPQSEMSEEFKRNTETKDELYAIQKDAAKFFYANLTSDAGKIARAYLESRGLGIGVSRKYGLGFSLKARDSLFRFLSEKGYDTELLLKSGLIIKKENGSYIDRFFNRLMFPIFDVSGKVIAFGGRVMDGGEPKYLNSSDTPLFNKSQTLYSINYARVSRKKEFILAEGYMDVIALYQAGFTNAVAALGTAFTDGHASLVRKYADSVFLCFDSDGAGVKAALRAIPILLKSGLQVRVIKLESAKDPDEYIKKFGSNAFAELISNAESYIMFQLNTIKKGYDLSNLSQAVEFTKEAAKMLSKVESSIELSAYTKEIANATDISADAIEKEILQLSDNKTFGDKLKRFTKRKTDITLQTPIGLDEARRSILYFSASDYDIFKKLQDVLEVAEFIEPVYIRLFELIVSSYEKKQSVYPADLISFFETPEEQKTVSSVFVNPKDYVGINDKEKALNDQLRLIKGSWLELQVLEAKNHEDYGKIQELALKIKKNESCSYISL